MHISETALVDQKLLESFLLEETLCQKSYLCSDSVISTEPLLWYDGRISE